ncbi:two-component system response regulator VicR [Enterococcus rotai]|uniref:OmpR/PhoB-type domain-containing protein n=1 Tax=Enterococcus rotai TaxID=118060 RepID=A0A0U2XCN9_9ENTE|nr:winged helix-turn-helix domain-containing protein [Enterococcus rotai]ALS36545.1 hypothetical protein ATZ35_05035 [Enterococcus rotai]
MYKIGYVSLPKDEEGKLIKSFNNHELSLTCFEKEDIVSHLNELDAILIKKNDILSSTTIFRLLIEIRKKTTKFLWILSEVKENSERTLFLELGANMVFDSSNNLDEVALIISNNLCTVKGEMKEQIFFSKSFSKKKKNGASFKLIPQNLSVLLGDEEEIYLTKQEFKILEILYKHSKTTVTYEEILNEVWKKTNNENYKKYRISNLIFHLRQKLDEHNESHTYIKTVRSKGYMLDI